MKKFELPNNTHIVQYMDNSFEMITEQGGLTDSEVFKLKNEIIKYGLFIEDKIPFVLIDLSIMKFDFAFNVYNLLINKQYDFFKKYSGRSSLIIVAPETHLGTIKREIWFQKNITALLINCLVDQLQFYNDEQEVNQRLSELEKKLSIDEMINHTEMQLNI